MHEFIKLIYMNILLENNNFLQTCINYLFMLIIISNEKLLQIFFSIYLLNINVII